MLLRSSCGRTIPLPVLRWLGEAEPEEHDLLDRALGPVLDVGCGPGRHVVALARRGIPALGRLLPNAAGIGLLIVVAGVWAVARAKILRAWRW